jgi:hypothetical protein
LKQCRSSKKSEKLSPKNNDLVVTSEHRRRGVAASEDRLAAALAYPDQTLGLDPLDASKLHE